MPPSASHRDPRPEEKEHKITSRPLPLELDCTLDRHPALEPDPPDDTTSSPTSNSGCQLLQVAPSSPWWLLALTCLVGRRPRQRTPNLAPTEPAP